MLRDLNGSDPLHLKYIIKKIKGMAYRAPNLVLETIHDYLVDNPEVGAAWAIGGSAWGVVGRARPQGWFKSWLFGAAKLFEASLSPHMSNELNGEEGRWAILRIVS